ncbi:MAG: hypothetical protein O7H41_16980 [Planctomycetota bacterium]|nr:hypothetical protein [Planctomycetota bacterium]
MFSGSRKTMLSFFSATLVCILQSGCAAPDPGITFFLSSKDSLDASVLLKEVFDPYMGKWTGTREGVDVGEKGSVQLTKEYKIWVGGPLVFADVQAGRPGRPAPFQAAKAYAYSPTRKTLLTYFFERGANANIFELDRSALSEGKLVWNEIMRKGRLFRVEETIPKDGKWTSTIWRQNKSGKYEVFARNTLERAEP